MNSLTKLLCSASAFCLVLATHAPLLAADCVTDEDCPDSACGGQVCQWLSTTSHVCQTAGSKSRGSDGWCNAVTDCKCQSVGAKCNAQFSCSFVLPADAPPAGGSGGAAGNGTGGSAGASGTAGITSGGAAGSSGNAGASSAEPSAGNAGSSGTPGSAGAVGRTPAAGGANAAPAGPITGSPNAPEAGGCSVSAPSKRGQSVLGIIFLGVALLAARRRCER